LRLGTLSIIKALALRTTVPIHVRKNGHLNGASRTLVSLITASPIRPTAFADYDRRKKSSALRRPTSG
jgi:hypothetical protein